MRTWSTVVLIFTCLTCASAEDTWGRAGKVYFKSEGASEYNKPVDDRLAGETVESRWFEVTGPQGWQLAMKGDNDVRFTRPGSTMTIGITALSAPAPALLEGVIVRSSFVRAEAFDSFGGDARGVRVVAVEKGDSQNYISFYLYPMANTTLLVLEAKPHLSDDVDHGVLDQIHRNFARSVRPLPASGHPLPELRDKLILQVHPEPITPPEPPTPIEVARARSAGSLTDDQAVALLQELYTGDCDVASGTRFTVPNFVAYLLSIWVVCLMRWPERTYRFTRSAGAAFGAVALVVWISALMQKGRSSR